MTDGADGGRDNGRPWDLLITNAAMLDGEQAVDIAIRDGAIAALDCDIQGDAVDRLDARGGLVTPSFVEPHFHLDKCLSRELLGALSPEEAFERAHEAKRQFTVSDVVVRASAALRLAVAHGIGRMLAQCDVDSATRLVSFAGLVEARQRFAAAIDLEIVAFPQEGIVKDPEAPGLLREALAGGASALGGLPEVEASEADQRRHIEVILDLAEEAGVPVEMHCDYLDRPALKTLDMLAEAVIERGLQGRVTASHCNALAVYPDEEAKRTIERVCEAGITVAILPIANLQMLGGTDRTPRNRGSSRAKELLDAGVNVVAGADNMFDIWYRFNRMDAAETGYLTCLSCGMRTDDEVRTAFDMVTTRAAQAVGLSDHEIAVGNRADLVVHEASSVVDIFRHLPARRVHIKNGRRVGGLEGSHWAIR